MFKNEKGQIFYGLHFYPGVAEYAEPGKEPFRVFLNENTIRAMDPTFAGRPVFVHHVDGVDGNVDDLRKDADGWVVESFYNAADGKHWVKFIVVSERGLRAVRNGMRLSNCYVPKSYAQGGLWNGVSYEKEVTGGEYEHLAIVPNPRYEESVIMTPDEFKKYNSDKEIELKRLANNHERKENRMALKFFRRAKVENSVDLEGLCLSLKSGREVTITELVAEAEAADAAKGQPRVANAGDTVEMGSTKMSVGDLVAKHQAMCDELEAFKKKNVTDADADKKENAEDDEEKKKKEEADKKANAEKEEAEKKEKEEADKKKNELAAAELAKAAEAKAKADALKNAHHTPDESVARVDLSDDQVARGKARYGSN